MSSTIFFAHWKPSITKSNIRHQLSDHDDMPIRRERYWYRPDGRRNVVRKEDSSSRGTWKYPLTASRLAKHLAVAGMDCKISFVLENGCTGLLMYLFSSKKYITGHILPLGLGTKKVWQHHGVGSVTFVMMPRSMSFLTYASARLWHRIRICLIVDALFGIILVSEFYLCQLHEDFVVGDVVSDYVVLVCYCLSYCLSLCADVVDLSDCGG